MGEEELVLIIQQRRKQMVLAMGIVDKDDLLSSDSRIQLGDILMYPIILEVRPWAAR